MIKERKIHKILREMFSKQPEWDNQTIIKNELEKYGVFCEQPTVSRALEDINAKNGKKERKKANVNERDKIPDGWYLRKATIEEIKLVMLKNVFNETTDSNSQFIKDDIKIAILKTKPFYNKILAQNIQDTFKSEIYSILCSGDTDIIIYYRKEEPESRIEKIIEEYISTRTSE